VPAEGGTGAITVGAARDCTWTAAVEGAQWLSISNGTNGQGDGRVEFSASPNPDPAVRRGAVILNAQRAEITQAAASCGFSLAQSSASFGQGGGSGSVQLRASSGMCNWTASADADWIVIRTPSGTGNAQVAFEVVATTGPPRTGTITLAGQKFSVTQSEGCSFAITPGSHSVQPAGGSGSIAIATTPGCPWTASSNAEWISLAQASGNGPASVGFTVGATSGPARTGSAVVAGQTFTVIQSQGCSFDVAPGSHSVGAAGGSLSISITSSPGCPWTASSEADWIAIQTGGSGTGSGTVGAAVAATSGPSRTGAMIVAGQRVTVTQSPGCAFSISPASASIAAGGGSGRVTVTSAAGCAWTAASNAPWLTIGSGSSGTGNGEVQYTAAGTTGPGRSGTMTIAGQTFTVNQGQGCTFALSAASATIADGGGQGSFDVTSAAGCGWTVASTVSWATVTSPTNVSGNGRVTFTVAANTGPPRSGAITAAGQTFTVQQGNGCSYSLSATSHNAAAGSGSGTVNVTAGAGCSWTATANAAWLTIGSGGSGSGNGTVGFNVAANAGAARSGTLTIAGRTFTVAQAEGCTFNISPDQAPVAAGGGPLSVAVTTPNGCGWTAAGNAPWIRITSGSPGSGNGTVQLAIDPHGGAPRSGTATIAGRTLTVNQASGCSFSITPGAQTVPAAAGSVPVVVTAAAGCAWTSTSNAPWLALQGGGSGNGNGSVQVDVQANTGAGRSGTVTIAGQTFTVTQDSGCSFVVAPDNLTSPAAGSAPRIDVTAAAGCNWTAVSAAAWITVAAGASGSGSGAVDLTVAAHTGPARSGTLTIAGRTVTIAQDSGCTFVLGAPSQTAPIGGGPGSVTVTSTAGCAWTAASNVPWITVTGGSPGSGDGTVQFTVDANGTGAPRVGTLTIAGQPYTINQD
jgi:hypothetical protein